MDVVVDLRVGSPRYGQWEAVRLDDENRHSLFVSEGLGHGFMALSETATTVYLCSTPYAPAREHGVHPLDPAVGIAWPTGIESVLSDKDAAATSLAEAHEAGLLPRYRLGHGLSPYCRSAVVVSRRDATNLQNPWSERRVGQRGCLVRRQP